MEMHWTLLSFGTLSETAVYCVWGMLTVHADGPRGIDTRSDFRDCHFSWTARL